MKRQTEWSSKHLIVAFCNLTSLLGKKKPNANVYGKYRLKQRPKEPCDQYECLNYEDTIITNIKSHTIRILPQTVLTECLKETLPSCLTPASAQL